MWEVVAKLIGAIVALAVVLLLAWLLLRWLSRRVPGGTGGTSRQRTIKVLDRMNVGKNGILLLVRVKDKVLLVAMGDHGAQKLYEFDDPDGEFDLPKPGQSPSFSQALKDAAKRAGLRGKDKDGGEGEP